MGLTLEGKVKSCGMAKNGASFTEVLTADEREFLKIYDKGGRKFRVGDSLRVVVDIPRGSKPFDGFVFLAEEQPEGYGAVVGNVQPLKKGANL